MIPLKALVFKCPVQLAKTGLGALDLCPKRGDKLFLKSSLTFASCLNRPVDGIFNVYSTQLVILCRILVHRFNGFFKSITGAEIICMHSILQCIGQISKGFIIHFFSSLILCLHPAEFIACIPLQCFIFTFCTFQQFQHGILQDFLCSTCFFQM